MAVGHRCTSASGMVGRFQRNRCAVGLSFISITGSSRRCPGQGLSRCMGPAPAEMGTGCAMRNPITAQDGPAGAGASEKYCVKAMFEDM